MNEIKYLEKIACLIEDVVNKLPPKSNYAMQALKLIHIDIHKRITATPANSNSTPCPTCGTVGTHEVCNGCGLKV